jgi:hypothetical protein
LLLTTAFGLFACSEPPPPPPPTPPPPAAPPFHTILDLKQFMLLVIDPAADGVWDSVKTIVTKKGTEEIRPKTDEQWTAVRGSAATVAEAANLLMLDGRARDKKEWMTAVRRLIDAGEKAMKAAEAKDADAVFATGGEIYEACRACHLRYAPHLNNTTEGVKDNEKDGGKGAPAAAPKEAAKDAPKDAGKDAPKDVAKK